MATKSGLNGERQIHFAQNNMTRGAAQSQKLFDRTDLDNLTVKDYNLFLIRDLLEVMTSRCNTKYYAFLCISSKIVCFTGVIGIGVFKGGNYCHHPCTILGKKIRPKKDQQLYS